jgi:pyrroloquinoline quinone (PQQ) biosynthesis protein C
VTNEAAIEASVAQAVGGRRLLGHPFYQRWQEGGLALAELAAYAAQYRYFEAELPEFLGAVVSAMPPGAARDLVAGNLHDETSVPAPHIDLFDGFARAVGAPATSPTPATEALLACYRRYAAAGGTTAIAALAAYEVQAAEVASSKAAGLRDLYGIDAAGTEFWDVHATADVAHARWVVEALADLAPNGLDESAAGAVAEAAQAWWGWLDEREAARPVAA